MPLLTRAGFQDLTEIRIHNEAHAARLAAGRMSVAGIDRLRELERNFRGSLENPDVSVSVRANKDLHFHVYEAAGSPVLHGLIAAMWLKAGPVINLDLGDASRRSRSAASVRNHAEMVAAIADRDPESAARALEADIRTAADFILSRDVLRD